MDDRTLELRPRNEAATQQPATKKEGRLRRAALDLTNVAENQGAVALAQTARIAMVCAVPSSFFSAAAQTSCAPPPIVPGVDSCTLVLKSALPSPITCAPPPTIDLPTGQSTLWV